MARTVTEDFQHEGARIREADTLDATTKNRAFEFVRDSAHRQCIKHAVILSVAQCVE